ncbi:unnamed protein product [Arabis nemorensis]|uniref:Uncharacterized protein n=1 Tax=Arabis nemorensis TaxID=586526 RepID=A0A565CV59_9BRAS|nr:unnamed protein product [Arabis nemorensis]
MIAPRAFSIVWGNDQRYWQWISLPNTRFTQVAEFIMVWWFDITGRINIEASLVMDGTETDDVHPSMVSLMQNPGGEESRDSSSKGEEIWVKQRWFSRRLRGYMGREALFFMESRFGQCLKSPFAI